MQYSKLTKDEDHDNWHRSFRGTALTHQLDHILDPTYVPLSKADKELFAAKQHFAYSVFEHILLTDKGKELVRTHELTSDAQTIYSELQTYAKNSTKAQIGASDILHYLSTTKYDDQWAFHHSLEKSDATVQ